MKKSLDTTDPVYTYLRDELEGVNSILKNVGKFDPNLELFDLVILEVGQILGSRGAAVSFAELAVRWRKEKNPNIANVLCLMCDQLGFIPPPSIFSVITEAAQASIIEEIKSNSKKKLFNEFKDSECFLLMAHLRFAGQSVEAAASQAAHWRKERYPESPKKASTLMKAYADAMRAKKADYRSTDVKIMTETREAKIIYGEISTEEELFRIWKKSALYPHKYWKNLAQILPMADEELHGNPRG